MQHKGHTSEKDHSMKTLKREQEDFVLEKSIFSNIFDKDIKRVFIYKKAERLAKAIHLITPAFQNTPSLRDRIDAIAVGLVDAAILSPSAARTALSRELLALSSMLSIARTGGMLSSMNTDLITNEAHALLQEVATYEEPRLFLDDTPSLSELSRNATHASTLPNEQTSRRLRQSDGLQRVVSVPRTSRSVATPNKKSKGHSKGQDENVVKDIDFIKDTRREAILSVIRRKGSTHIKDISTVIRNVSEKTIQRELSILVANGVLLRKGERRWTSYVLAE